MRIAHLVLCCVLVVVGCGPHPTQYVMESSFALGTNAVVTMNQKLPIRGYYEFTFELLRVDHDRFEVEKWPVELDVKLHILVRTNGHTAMDTNVSKLKLSHISDKRNVAAYFPPSGGFIVTSDNVAMDCTLEDHTDEPKHPVHLVLFNAVAK